MFLLHRPTSSWLLALMTVAASSLILAFSFQNTVAQPARPEPSDLKTLQAQLEQLKGLLPDQAHAMSDVDYHFSHLWFAAQQKNWPLADFYLGETRSHLQWAVRIKPVRVDSAKKEVKLTDILQALENSPLTQLKGAIEAKDQKKFAEAYRFTLEGCYACHKASEKPYLKPRIPTSAQVSVINPDPQADWPK